MSEEFESQLAELKEQLRELQQDEDRAMKAFQAATQQYRDMTMMNAARRVSLMDALDQLMDAQIKAANERDMSSTQSDRTERSSSDQGPEYHKETCREYKSTGKCTKHNFPLYHTLLSTGPPGLIPVNAQNHRIDMMMRLPHWKLWHEYDAHRMSHQLCVDFHIHGKCDNEDKCSYTHGPPVNDGTKSCMKYRLWKTVCNNVGACRRLDCLMGYNCHFNPCTKASCNLPHDVDTKIVRWVPPDDGLPPGGSPVGTVGYNSGYRKPQAKYGRQPGNVNLIDM